MWLYLSKYDLRNPMMRVSSECERVHFAWLFAIFLSADVVPSHEIHNQWMTLRAKGQRMLFRARVSAKLYRVVRKGWSGGESQFSHQHQGRSMYQILSWTWRVIASQPAQPCLNSVMEKIFMSRVVISSYVLEWKIRQLDCVPSCLHRWHKVWCVLRGRHKSPS